MNIKAVLSAIALTAVFTAPAIAASFSFNRADADRMVNFAKEEGITLPKDVAESIVKYRSEGHQFLTEDDLAKVPGMTPQLLMILSPEETGTDLLFNPEGSSGMKAY